MRVWDQWANTTPLLERDSEPMFPIRMNARVPTPPIGRDLAAAGFCDDGSFYYCKDDDGHRPVRATEQLFTTLADHLNIPTAPTRTIEIDGHLLFGSRKHPSTEEHEAVRTFFSQPGKNEFGGSSSWKGGYFSRLLAYDAFVGNVDRGGNNFVAHRDGGSMRILAIDFAASTLLMRPGLDIRLDGTQTLAFARMMKALHAFDEDAALEMVGRLESVPTSFVDSVMDRMPPGWLDAGVARRFVEFWGGGERIERLARLRVGLRNGSLH